jgi:hypothetical protein
MKRHSIGWLRIGDASDSTAVAHFVRVLAGKEHLKGLGFPETMRIDRLTDVQLVSIAGNSMSVPYLEAVLVAVIASLDWEVAPMPKLQHDPANRCCPPIRFPRHPASPLASWLRRPFPGLEPVSYKATPKSMTLAICDLQPFPNYLAKTTSPFPAASSAFASVAQLFGKLAARRLSNNSVALRSVTISDIGKEMGLAMCRDVEFAPLLSNCVSWLRDGIIGLSHAGGSAARFFNTISQLPITGLSLTQIRPCEIHSYRVEFNKVVDETFACVLCQDASQDVGFFFQCTSADVPFTASGATPAVLGPFPRLDLMSICRNGNKSPKMNKNCMLLKSGSQISGCYVAASEGVSVPKPCAAGNMFGYVPPELLASDVVLAVLTFSEGGSKTKLSKKDAAALQAVGLLLVPGKAAAVDEHVMKRKKPRGKSSLSSMDQFHKGKRQLTMFEVARRLASQPAPNDISMVDHAREAEAVQIDELSDDDMQSLMVDHAREAEAVQIAEFSDDDMQSLMSGS